MHGAKRRGLLQWRQQLPYREVVPARGPVGLFRSACGDRWKQVFAFKRCTAGTIGIAVLQNQILPFLEQSRGGIPIKRKLQNDGIMLSQALLFARDVNLKAWVFGI